MLNVDGAVVEIDRLISYKSYKPLPVSLCVHVSACVCGGFLIEQFSNIIWILLSEYRIIFLPEMHIPSTRIFKGTIQVWLSLLLWKKNELCKPSSQHYFNNPCLGIQKWKCHNQVYWCFHCCWSTAILRCWQTWSFLKTMNRTVPYRDLKTEVRTEPWLLWTVTPSC